MRPQPAAIMSGSAAWTQVKVPVRFTAMIRSHFSAVMSRTASKDSMPALVTRISIGPRSRRICANAWSTDARSATSVSTAIALVPLARSSSAALSAAGPLRSRTATLWPFLASSSATPKPMPEAPPVTTATRLTGRTRLG
jgi:hypothetical protein